jgi:acetylornithine deacetylase/succinyl-diaminopimelate desuccinylase-like protein
VSSASAGVTIRVAPSQDPEVLAAAAEAILRAALPEGARLEVESDLTPPALLPRDTDALRLAREAFARVFGHPPLVVRAGGTLPILAALADRGIPTVMAGLALPDSHTHSPNERMLLETFPLGVEAARETYSRSGLSVPAARQPERRVDEPDVAVRLGKLPLCSSVSGRMSSE